MLNARCRIPAWGNMLVTNRQSSPRRIMAVSNNGEISLWAHHASVTPMASKAVPATTGYRGISLSLGAGRMRLHATTEVGRASSLSSLRLRRYPACWPCRFELWEADVGESRSRTHTPGGNGKMASTGWKTLPVDANRRLRYGTLMTP